MKNDNFNKDDIEDLISRLLEKREKVFIEYSDHPINQFFSNKKLFEDCKNEMKKLSHEEFVYFMDMTSMLEIVLISRVLNTLNNYIGNHNIALSDLTFFHDICSVVDEIAQMITSKIKIPADKLIILSYLFANKRIEMYTDNIGYDNVNNTFSAMLYKRKLLSVPLIKRVNKLYNKDYKSAIKNQWSN